MSRAAIFCLFRASRSVILFAAQLLFSWGVNSNGDRVFELRFAVRSIFFSLQKLYEFFSFWQK